MYSRAFLPPYDVVVVVSVRPFRVPYFETCCDYAVVVGSLLPCQLLDKEYVEAMHLHSQFGGSDILKFYRLFCVHWLTSTFSWLFSLNLQDYFFYQYCLFVLSFLINAGDPALLHMQIRDCNLDMQSIEKMSLHALRDLCEKCSIPVSTVKSQVIFQLVVCVM